MGLHRGLFLGLLVALSGGLQAGLAVVLEDLLWGGGLEEGVTLAERSLALLRRAGGKLDNSGGLS